MTTTTLALPKSSNLLNIIEASTLADTTKYQYKKALRMYLDTGSTLSDTASLSEYATGLKQSSRAFLKASIKLVSRQAATLLKASANGDNIDTVRAGLLNLDAVNDVIHVERQHGTKVHTWLTQSQISKIMASIDTTTLPGRRDWIVLALLFGAGLRRSELAALTSDDVKSAGLRTVLEVRGKGGKGRVVPISDKLAEKLAKWIHEVGEGRIARSAVRKHELGASMSGQAIFNLVARYGKRVLNMELAPHDCRRTFAQLGYEAGVPLAEVMVLLGHATLATTQKYLNLELDLSSTISDYITL